MPEKEVKKTAAPTPAAPETVAKADFDKLVADYQKLANAFNKLLQEYNNLHVTVLLQDDNK